MELIAKKTEKERKEKSILASLEAQKVTGADFLVGNLLKKAYLYLIIYIRGLI